MTERPERESAVAITFSLPPSYAEKVQEIAEQEFDGNRSMALRRMIDIGYKAMLRQLPLPSTHN